MAISHVYVKLSKLNSNSINVIFFRNRNKRHDKVKEMIEWAKKKGEYLQGFHLCTLKVNEYTVVLFCLYTPGTTLKKMDNV